MPKEIYEVLDSLEQNGFKAYLIGGYVRDKILKKESLDIDITTNARVKDMVNIFNKYDVKIFDYGNISFIKDKYKIEITTFRKDISYEDNRRPDKITYVDTLEEDLSRRDFTINAIAMDKNENIIDLYDGIKDLKRKKIKTIRPALEEIKEDSLRILRAIRFATILDFKIENDLKEAIINNKELLNNLSFERKKEELNKIFVSKNKRKGIKLLKEYNLLEVLNLKNIDNVLKTNYVLGMWATIMEKEYPFTKNDKELINDINNLLQEDINDELVLYKYGLYSINVVCDLKKLNKKKIVKKYENLPIKDKKEINITANEICKILNKPTGSFLKTIYQDLEKSILLNNLENDKNKIIEYIKYKYM